MNTPYGKFVPYKAVNNLPYDKLRLRSENSDWYAPYSVSSSEKTEEIICNFLKQKKYEQIIVYGGSMGGYAAIDYGLRINADIIISCGAELLFGFKNTFSVNCVKKETAKTLNRRINEWKKFITKKSLILSIYSANNIQDLFNSFKFYRKTSIKPVYWDCDHSIPTYINSNYRLDTFIKNIADSRTDLFFKKNDLEIDLQELKKIIIARHIWKICRKKKQYNRSTSCIYSNWHHLKYLTETNNIEGLRVAMNKTEYIKDEVEFFWMKLKTFKNNTPERLEFVEDEYKKNQNKIGIKLQYIQELIDTEKHTRAKKLFDTINPTEHPWAQEWCKEIQNTLAPNDAKKYTPTPRKTKGKNIPDFLCIGAQKAGTSWLFANLRKNKNIWMPPIKELHFFDHLFCHENRSWTTWHIQKSAEKLLRKECLSEKLNFEYISYLSHLASKELFTQSWYEYAFSFKKNKSTLYGDITPEYSTIPEEGIEFLKTYLQSPKIIYIIRDPFSRVCSQLLMNAKFSGFSRDTTEEKWTNLAKSSDIATRGDYKTYIPRWTKFFSEENILFIPFGLLNKDSSEFVKKIENFLEVPHMAQEEVIREKIWSSEKLPIPSTVSEYLQELTRPQYDFLKSNFTKDFIELL